MECDSRHNAVINAFKPKAKHLHITGVSFSVCRHGSVFRAAPMRGGERSVHRFRFHSLTPFQIQSRLVPTAGFTSTGHRIWFFFV